MRVLRKLSIATASAAALAAVFVACTTDYQQGLNDPSYGAPNALAGQTQPGSSNDTAQPTGTTDGGTTANGTTPECVKAGGQLLGDAGACAVSFKTDILPGIGVASPSCTQTVCHGGNNPPNQPRIEPSDPAAMYDVFAAFKISTGLPYINPCSTDPTKAAIECNLAATGTCGNKMPVGGNADPALVTKIDTWLKCGSPNN